MSKTRLHKRVHRLYKILLGVLAVVFILFLPAKITILVLTLLWIYEEEIECLIERFIRRK